jgi:hypothetical protein
MSDTRPSGGEGDGAALLLASARARLAAATADLALPEPLRLSDRERLTASRLLARLIRDVEDELRSGTASGLGGEAYEPARAALASASLPIAGPILSETGAFADPLLVSLLLRRTEEHRLSRAATESRTLTGLAGDGDSAVAAASVSLIVALSRRLDAFQEPLLAVGDLPAEVEHSLVWTIAAALRRYLVVTHLVPPADADSAVSAAAAAILAGFDEGSGVDALARRLASRLDQAGRLDDRLLVQALEEGLLPLFLAGLAVRTGLEPQPVWELLSEPAGRGAALLLRAAGFERSAAAAALLRLARDESALAVQLDLFDTTGAEEARQLLALWRRDPAYRAAIGRLAS